jgi:glutamine amidotransferase
MIKLVDVGFGNVSSLRAWLYNSGLNFEVMTGERRPDKEDVVLMPGVGSANFAMAQLKSSGLYQSVLEHILTGGRYIGICVGMQILFGHHDEGPCVGFGVFEGKIVSLGSNSNTKWSNLKIQKTDIHPNWQLGFGRKEKFEARVFNNHSFGALGVKLKVNEFLLMDESDTFVQVVGSRNVIGFQFHPEKSQKFGDLIASFMGRIA